MVTATLPAMHAMMTPSAGESLRDNAVAFGI
ncbi:hypothetical protein ACVWXN_006768 [Bradyrhizobium sp. i1.4.4]